VLILCANAAHTPEANSGDKAGQIQSDAAKN